MDVSSLFPDKIPTWFKIIFQGGGLLYLLHLVGNMLNAGWSNLKSAAQAEKQAEVERERVESEREVSVLEELRQQYSDLYDRQEELKTNLRSVRHENRSMRRENMELKLQNEKIIKENEQLQEQNEKIEIERRRLTKVVMVLKARFDRLVEHLVEHDTFDDMQDVPNELIEVAETENPVDLIDDSDIDLNGDFASPLQTSNRESTEEVDKQNGSTTEVFEDDL
jgi:predicted nuclease with TOPRIM domain